LEPASLLQYADELLALTTEHGLGLFRALALIQRGWCLAALGRVDEGIPLLTAGLAGWDELGFTPSRPCYLSLLGDAYRMAGQQQAALERFAEAGRLAEETKDRYFLGETLRLTAEVLLAIGDPAATEASYHEAIAIAQRQSARLWELCAAMSLARLWRDQGKRTEARDLLAPVYGWFTEGFGTPVLQEAKALLDGSRSALAVSRLPRAAYERAPAAPDRSPGSGPCQHHQTCHTLRHSFAPSCARRATSRARARAGWARA
jgi:predicted ATPase